MVSVIVSTILSAIVSAMVSSAAQPSPLWILGFEERGGVFLPDGDRARRVVGAAETLAEKLLASGDFNRLGGRPGGGKYCIINLIKNLAEDGYGVQSKI